MECERIKKWFTPGLAIILFIVNLPIVPKVISLVINCILAAFSLASTVFIYKYYESLPLANKTILTHLMQFSMYSCGLNIIVFFLIIPNLIYFTPEFIQYCLTHVPDLTCSTLLPEPYFILTFLFFYAIVIFKSMARLLPTVYLGMNHEYVKKFALLMIITAWQLDMSLILYRYQTLCTDNMFYKIEVFYGMKVDKPIKLKPPMSANHFMVLWMPQTLSYLCKFISFSINICKKCKEQRLLKYFELTFVNKVQNYTPDTINERSRITKDFPPMEDIELAVQREKEQDIVLDEKKEKGITNQLNMDIDNDIEPEKRKIEKDDKRIPPSSNPMMIFVEEKTSTRIDKKVNPNTNFQKIENDNKNLCANNEIEVDSDTIEYITIETAINSVEDRFLVSNNKPSCISKEQANTEDDGTLALRPQILKLDLLFGLGSFGSILLMAGNKFILRFKAII